MKADIQGANFEGAPTNQEKTKLKHLMSWHDVDAVGSAAFAGGHAACGPDGQSVRILASDFPAIHAVAGTAEENCAAGASEFTRNHTTEARQIMNAALTPNPAEYTSVIVANSTLTQLMNDGLVRPLNDLVDKYGENIPDNLKIQTDGNAWRSRSWRTRSTYFRTDILEQAGGCARHP